MVQKDYKFALRLVPIIPQCRSLEKKISYLEFAHIFTIVVISQAVILSAIVWSSW